MLVRWLIVSIAGALIIAPSTTLAQQAAQQGQAPITGGETVVAKQLSLDKSKPLLLQSDELIYDNRNNRVLARGDVEIHFNDHIIKADEVIYDKGANTLTAVGNVRIKEPDGSLINADRITLKDDFRDGFLRSLRVVTEDDARIAASNAYRISGNTTVYENGVFTPCKPCAEHPERPPLWRIKATKIIQDKQEQNIYYENASLEFFGVPVAWTPYFQMPDPSVKQRSGFLGPSVINSTNLGWATTVPYYVAISPSTDFLLTPTITTKAGYLAQGEWRQKLEDGAYRVTVAGVYNDNATDTPGDNKFRGSIETHGDFNINSFWKWGWNGIIESDETFRRFYGLDSIYATQRISDIHLTGIGDRNYFNAAVYRFGSLANIYNDPSLQVPNVAGTSYPVLDYNYVHNKPVLGGEFSFNVNVTNTTVDNQSAYVQVLPTATETYGRDNAHIITDAQWRRTFTDDIGERITPIAQGRFDLYHVSAFSDPDGQSGPADTFTRQMVAGGVDYRYPFVAHTDDASHVIEPVAQIIARTNPTNNDKVPNQDAQSLVFDDTLLFDLNKFSGYDRIETGTRANAGLQYTMQTNSGVSLRMVGGESYQIAGTNSYIDPTTGLASIASDYVLGGYLDWRNLFRFTSQIRLNEKDLTLARQDYSLTTKLGPVRFTVSYVEATAEPLGGFPTARQEVAGFAAYKLDDYWTVFGDLRYDLTGGYFIRDSAGIQYSDECFTLALTWTQTNITYLDIKPSTAVMLRYGLKFLGQQTTSDAIGDLSPEAAVFK